MATIYQLKPAFQNLLRPITVRLARGGVTANQVTLAAAVVSVALGATLCVWPEGRPLFLLLPVWLFIRMALNAIDGMLAREHGQASKLGLYLNELSDLVSDAALALPFVFVPPFEAPAVLAFIFAALLAEVAGMLGQATGIGRNYAGPFGKSDRAFVLGLLGAIVGIGITLPAWMALVFPLGVVLSLATLANRISKGIR